nr:uncharacterized protein LOC102395160 isoform X3 [Bubalus bubalis]
MESGPPGGLTAQHWSPVQEAGCSSGDAAGEPWQHLDPGLLQRLLEEKEWVQAVLRETVKVLQMKVARLEHLVKLKDQRIGALTQWGPAPGRGYPGARRAPSPVHQTPTSSPLGNPLDWVFLGVATHCPSDVEHRGGPEPACPQAEAWPLLTAHPGCPADAA